MIKLDFVILDGLIANLADLPVSSDNFYHYRLRNAAASYTEGFGFCERFSSEIDRTYVSKYLACRNFKCRWNIIGVLGRLVRLYLSFK